VSRDSFNEEDWDNLTKLYDIVYIPQGETTGDDDRVEIGNMTMIAKNTSISYTVDYIPDAMGFQTDSSDGYHSRFMFGTTAVRCTNKDKKVKITGSAYGSAFSSPESRNTTFENLISYLKF
jgi:hypothetical protein